MIVLPPVEQQHLDKIIRLYGASNPNSKYKQTRKALTSCTVKWKNLSRRYEKATRDDDVHVNVLKLLGEDGLKLRA
jgi:hypothetical protein